MNVEDAEEVFATLLGHQIIDWGRDDTMYHLTLDDGRILVFMALGIVMMPDHAVH